MCSLKDPKARSTQLAHYVVRGYGQYNKSCVLYVQKWNISELTKKHTCYLYCKHELCRELKAECQFFDDFIHVTVYRKKDEVGATHIYGKTYKPDLRGPAREVKKQSLKTNFALNVQAEMNASISSGAAEGGRLDTVSLEVLRKAREEALNEMYSGDQLQNLIDFSLDHREYVRGLRLLPVAVYTYDDCVIDMIKNNEFEDTVYLDSTGQTSKFPLAEKRMMTYDLIGVHKLSGKRIPITHMLSERHRTFDIHLWLLEYLQGFVTNRSSITFKSRIKRIVTDMSWAEIGAIISTFSNFDSVQHYLDACFLLNIEEQKPNFVIVQLCHAHMMKIISKFIRERTKDKKVISIFMNAMRLASEIDNIFELNAWFAEIAHIFGSKSITGKVKSSLESLKKKIEQRKGTNDDISIKGLEKEDENIDYAELSAGNEGQWSRFYHHFKGEFIIAINKDNLQ